MPKPATRSPKDRLSRLAATVHRQPWYIQYAVTGTSFASVIVLVALGHGLTAADLQFDRASPLLLVVVWTAFVTNRWDTIVFAGLVGFLLSVGLCWPADGTAYLSRGLVFGGTALLAFQIVRSERTARLIAIRRAQDAIAATQAKDQFLAAVNHDLLGALTSINVWLKTLRRDKANVETVERAADGIENTVEQQKRLINDLLDTARIAAGKVQLQINPVMLDNVLAMACDTVAPGARTRGVRLIPPAQTLLRIPVDRDRIRQVLWNLLANAVKFTPAGGTVTVTVEDLGGSVAIRIADTGRGISEDDLLRIFEPWFQRDSSVEGRGLGLMISRRLVEMHGGALKATSLGLGQGAEFVVTLPTVNQ